MMSDKIENLVRAWGESLDVSDVPRTPVGDECLDFATAEAIARGRLPIDSETHDHLAACDRCQRLVADFREALAEEANTRRTVARPRILRIALPAAAAAAILIGVGLFMLSENSTHTPGQAPLLEMAFVTHTDQAGLQPKGEPTFASGDEIVVQTVLKSPANVLLLHIGPDGTRTFLPPNPDQPQTFIADQAGPVTCGPYRLDGQIGTEHFLLIATKAAPEGLAHLQEDTLAQPFSTPDSLAAHIRTWPASVERLSIQHIPAPMP
jgi:hypothetical protein